MALISTDPRFKYEDIAPPAISVSQFDAMMFAVIDPEPVKKIGIWGLIVNGIRGVVVLVWLAAREKLINQQLELAKQKYERDQQAGNQGDLDRDNLESQKRTP